MVEPILQHILDAAANLPDMRGPNWPRLRDRYYAIMQAQTRLDAAVAEGGIDRTLALDLRLAREDC